MNQSSKFCISIVMLAVVVSVSAVTPPVPSCVVNGYTLVYSPQNAGANKQTRFQNGALEVCLDFMPQSIWDRTRCTKYVSPQTYLENFLN